MGMDQYNGRAVATSSAAQPEDTGGNSRAAFHFDAEPLEAAESVERIASTCMMGCTIRRTEDWAAQFNNPSDFCRFDQVARRVPYRSKDRGERKKPSPIWLKI